MEEENKGKVVKEPFNVDDFYRKVGIGLLALLLVLIIIIGTILFMIQQQITRLIVSDPDTNFIEKSEIRVIDPNSGEETPVLDGQDVTE